MPKLYVHVDLVKIALQGLCRPRFVDDAQYRHVVWRNAMCLKGVTAVFYWKVGGDQSMLEVDATGQSKRSGIRGNVLRSTAQANQKDYGTC